MLVASLFLALAAQAAMPDESPEAAPRVVLARVAACGVKPRDARIRVDDMLQEAVVDIRPATAPPDAQLACLARASAETRWFLIFDAATQARFEPLYYVASQVAARTRARGWVAAHGLASRVPHYRQGHDDPAIVVAKIEQLCAIPAGRFRGTADEMALQGEALLSDAQLICAVNVATVAGLPVGFIGNAAEAPDPPH